MIYLRLTIKPIKKFNLENFNNRHYHAACVKDKSYTYRKQQIGIYEEHTDDFFAQIPEIEGLINI